MDPYDFFAMRQSTETRTAIARFWEMFAEKADMLDEAFNSNDGSSAQNSISVMDTLKTVSPDLMWEFGPSERGHALCVTAEWRDELRPLARLVKHMAPDLPRWEFIDARSADDPSSFSPENFASRFREDLAVQLIDVSLNEFGRIDLVAKGKGATDHLGQQALSVATMALGEAVEKDWVGFVDGETLKSGGLSFLRRSSGPQFDPAQFVERFHAEIVRAKSAMPAKPYAQLPLDERAVTVFKPNQLPEEHPRSDLFTFLANHETYGQAVLRTSRFSSRCYSKHDEWFLYLRIPRTPDAPFDDVDDRYDVESLLHERLSTEGAGGFVAGGHGQEAVYIDLALRDVDLGVALIYQALADKPYAREATLHFLDSGLTHHVVPAASTQSVLN